MREYDRAWEDLHHAVRILAGEGSQKERLIRAFSRLRIRPEQLPDEISEEYRNFMVEMTSIPEESNEGSITATINSLDEIAVGEATEKIIKFYGAVCRYSPL